MSVVKLPCGCVIDDLFTSPEHSRTEPYHAPLKKPAVVDPMPDEEPATVDFGNTARLSKKK